MFNSVCHGAASRPSRIKTLIPFTQQISLALSGSVPPYCADSRAMHRAATVGFIGSRELESLTRRLAHTKRVKQDAWNFESRYIILGNLSQEMIFVEKQLK